MKSINNRVAFGSERRRMKDGGKKRNKFCGRYVIYENSTEVREIESSVNTRR